ncbi:MAG: ABC transporter permease [Bacteroidota bacterium]
MSIYTTALLLGLAYAALGIGIFISMRIFRIPDITTDGSFTLGGAVTASLTTALFPTGWTWMAVFLAGTVAGAVTGWIHTKLRVNALLAGILVSTGLYSINLAIMGRPNIPLIDTPNLFSLLTDSPADWQSQAMVLGVFALLLILSMNHLLRSDFGLAMRATGNNETMARAAGISVDRMKIIGLALSNGLVAVSGYLIVCIQAYADINMGIGIVILGLGSVMIGEIPGKLMKKESMLAKLIGVLTGSILFRMILGWTLSIGVDPLYLKLVVALFVLAAVGLPQLSKRA